MIGTPELGSAEPCGPEEIGEVWSHLLVADDVLAVGPLSSSYVAACGAEVDTLSGGGDDPGYCPACVRAALRWQAPRHRPEPGQADVSGTRFTGERT